MSDLQKIKNLVGAAAEVVRQGVPIHEQHKGISEFVVAAEAFKKLGRCLEAIRDGSPVTVMEKSEVGNA